MELNLRSIDLDGMAQAFPAMERKELKRIAGIVRRMIIAESGCIFVEYIVKECFGIEGEGNAAPALRENTENYRQIVLFVVKELGCLPSYKQIA